MFCNTSIKYRKWNNEVGNPIKSVTEKDISKQFHNTPQKARHTRLNEFLQIKDAATGISLVVQWVRLHTPNSGGLGSITGQGTRSHMHAANKSLYATTMEPAFLN